MLVKGIFTVKSRVWGNEIENFLHFLSEINPLPVRPQVACSDSAEFYLRSLFSAPEGYFNGNDNLFLVIERSNLNGIWCNLNVKFGTKLELDRLKQIFL